MKTLTIALTCLLWLVVVAIWAYQDIKKVLAAPDAVGYIAQWDFQLFFFALTHMPILLVILGAVLLVEWKFIPPSSEGVRAAKSEVTNDSSSSSSESRRIVLLLRVVGLLYGAAGMTFAAVLFRMLFTYGLTYPVQLEYLGIGAGVCLVAMYGFLALRHWGRLLGIVVNGLYLLVFSLTATINLRLAAEAAIGIGAVAIIGLCLTGKVATVMRR